MTIKQLTKNVNRLRNQIKILQFNLDKDYQFVRDELQVTANILENVVVRLNQGVEE